VTFDLKQKLYFFSKFQ